MPQKTTQINNSNYSSDEEKRKSIDELIAYVAHEIKAPFSTIKLNMEMLNNTFHFSETGSRSYQIIVEEMSKIDRLLKNIYMYTHKTEIVNTRVNLFELVRSVEEIYKPLLFEKGIQLNNSIDGEFIEGDYPKLKILFSHLIENSIDAIATQPDSQPKNGTIDLYTRKENDHLSIFIKDSGCGIQDESKIFSPFYTTKAHGTGLGLSISKKIIEQHSGDIKLLSSNRGHTIFEIYFSNKK